MPIMKICVCGRALPVVDRCICKIEADRARNRKRRELAKQKKKLEKVELEREYIL